MATPAEALALLAAADAPLADGEGDAVAVVSSRGGGAFARRVLRFESDGSPGSPPGSPQSPTSATVAEGCVVDEAHIAGGPAVVGFGGAFTDASVANLSKAKEVDAAVEWLFGPKGMSYSLTRVHMASCDFCERSYTYVEKPEDLECASFGLAPEDSPRMEWLRRAGAARGEPLRILASPWTAPPWMKIRHSGFVGGELRREDEVYRAWARYFVRFLSAYSEAGLPVWAVTPQNEPNELPSFLRQTWETMFWDTKEMIRFIGEFLGPAIAAEHPEVLIVAHDDQRLDMPEFTHKLTAHPKALKSIGGIGFHWYQYPPKPYGGSGWTDYLWSLGRVWSLLPGDTFHLIRETRQLLAEAGREDAVVMCTEMCAGFAKSLSPPCLGPSMGDWDRGEVYCEEILRSLSNGMTAWLDWNLVLDAAGGPNWAKNMCDAPLILSQDWRLQLQPMCLAIAHFSHFILPGARRLITRGQTGAQYSVAFNSGDRIVVVLLNRAEVPCKVHLNAPGRGSLKLELPAHSFATVCWRALETVAPRVVTTPRGDVDSDVGSSGLFGRCSRRGSASEAR